MGGLSGSTGKTRAPRWLMLAVAALLIQACGPSYPLGMSEAEWSALSPEQQLEARQQQTAINIERRAEHERQQQEMERQRAAEEQAERERIERIIAQRVPGSIIDCAIERGEVRYRVLGAWLQPVPVAFTLIRGEGQKVELTSPQKHGRPTETLNLWVRYDISGHQLAFCPIIGVETNHPSCDRAAVLGSDVEASFTRPFNIPRFIRNGHIRCENAVRGDAGQRIIIRR